MNNLRLRTVCYCLYIKRRYSSIKDDVRLFTPGPLNTTHSVKAVMMRDLGSRDSQFIQMIADVRKRLLQVAGLNEREYTAIPMQGSGTFAVEAAIQTVVPRKPSARVLVLSGGAYGERIARMCSYLSVDHDVLRNAADSVPDMAAVEDQLRRTEYSCTAVVHCETSSGVINPVQDIGSLVKQCQPDCRYLVDAMSSFGGVPLDVPSCNADFVISSANKCIQGVPGVAFVFARLSTLLNCQGNSRSLSLDLYDQYKGLADSGMFRFTPPIQVMLALRQALVELEVEGGVEGRARRYRANHSALNQGMVKLGFVPVVSADVSSYIITSYRYPSCNNFNFDIFYSKLKAKGQVLYPGKMSSEDCFRIANIGDLDLDDINKLLESIRDVCIDMELEM